MTQERTEIYGRGQLLANWGGLLGLFMGFSVISMFEVVYFLMMKLASYTRQRGRQCWKVIIGCLMAVMILLFVSFAIGISTVTM